MYSSSVFAAPKFTESSLQKECKCYYYNQVGYNPQYSSPISALNLSSSISGSRNGVAIVLVIMVRGEDRLNRVSNNTNKTELKIILQTVGDWPVGNLHRVNLGVSNSNPNSGSKEDSSPGPKFPNPLGTPPPDIKMEEVLSYSN